MESITEHDLKNLNKTRQLLVELIDTTIMQKMQKTTLEELQIADEVIIELVQQRATIEKIIKGMEE